MSIWIVVGAAVLLLFSAGFLPAVLDASYDARGFRLQGRIGTVPISFDHRNRTASRGEEKVSKQNKKQSSDSIRWILLKNGYTTLSRQVARLRVTRLRARLIAAGGKDPAAAAMLCGAAGTAMEALTRLSGGRIRELELFTDVDFDAEESRFEGRICLRLRLAHLSGAAFHFGFGLLADYIRLAGRERKKNHGSSR